MQFFERSEQPRTASRRVQAPASVLGPDGQFSIALPGVVASESQRSAAGSSAAAGVEASQGAPLSRMVHLLHPCVPITDSRPGVLLYILLSTDTCVLSYVFARLAWDGSKNQTEYVGASSIASMVANIIGFIACASKSPTLLGFFAVVVFVQFLASVLAFVSTIQLLHCLVQPLLVHAALRMRKTFTPAWFVTGRRASLLTAW